MLYEKFSLINGKKSIRSAFEIWSLKSHGIGSGQGPSPSELQSQSVTKVQKSWTTGINEGRALAKARTSFMKWTPGLLLEQVSVSMASRQLSVFHIACLFMANDQFQSSTTARSCLFKVAVFHSSSIIKIREIKNHSRAHSRVIFLKGAYLK
ncbi:hypothetical protein DBT36_05895 [Aerococcus mictus]|nr:hypothetical protein HMPREF2680_04485 [Aerococcus mictus]PKY82267.1 hypothetical protein CYJ31_06720 [Aerococcus mictus]PMB93280.1 hypothetical protein CK795_06690 [Aerococcus mictus]RAV62451.1 hypothetical protein DBT35_07770 [Aerococcus mictus]RAV70499.1 hypothetical protein DBT47_06785 [Aerococcus mictus]